VCLWNRVLRRGTEPVNLIHVLNLVGIAAMQSSSETSYKLIDVWRFVVKISSATVSVVMTNHPYRENPSVEEQ
jgi:hypothetical protein